jgi:hypothetical protein
VGERDNLPRWRGERGRYEVWFLTLSDPARRAAYWIRYTLRAPVAGPPEPHVWFAAFSLDDPGATFGINRLLPPEELRLARDRFEVGMGGSEIRSGHAVGEIRGAGHEVRWDIDLPPEGATFRLLPGTLYRGNLAPTKPMAPDPDLRATGTIEIDGEARTLDDLPGQQGHVFGTRHAERWAWAACNAFEDDGVVFQAVSAQGRRGPFLTPFFTLAGLRLGGRWIRLRGVARRRDWGLGWWRISLVGKRHRLDGEITGDPAAMVRARYLDPDDTPRWCHNSEVASCRLTLWERRAGGWHAAADLTSEGTTHAEWAGRTPAPGVDALHQEVP